MYRIANVAAVGPSTVAVTWTNSQAINEIDLQTWIATGGETLRPLLDPHIFSQVFVADDGAAIAWDDHDLAIDAVHLKRLADGDARRGNV